MDSETFIREALRSKSDLYHVHTFEQWEIAAALEGFVQAARSLDTIKKAVFYNRPFHRPTFDNQINATLYSHITANFAQLPPDYVHGVLGLATEVAELVEGLIKAAVEPDGEIDMVNLEEEVGDLHWYEALLYNFMQKSFPQGFTKVINKLRVRFPDKFTTERALNRDLMKEAEVLKT